MTEQAITVRGARVNNLKNISFSIPIERLTVVTGVSGSGKSSLAFDTVYAEGQRRYVESLSAYARQFLERMDKPDVDEVLGIPPAIAIRQKNSTRNPRSTVGTQTEIYDYLRLLYARVGTTFCRVCGREVHHDSPESSAQEVLETLPEGTRFYVLFPAEAGLKVEPNGDASKKSAKGKKGTRAKKPDAAHESRAVTAHVMSLMQRGFTRLLVGGETLELRTPDDYKRADFEGVHVLIDRLAARPDVRQRLVDSFETCFIEGHGQAIVETPGRSHDGCASPSASSASTTARSTRSPSRVSSASTILSARARPARASATPSDSTSTLLSRTPRSRSKRARSSRGRSRSTNGRARN